MDREVTRVGIFTNIAPLYVQPLWKQLISVIDINYTFISSAFGHEGIKVINYDAFLSDLSTKGHWRIVQNKYLGSALIYQVGVVKEVLKNDFDIYIFSGEMYTLSTWIGAVICRLRKKPTFFWGHGIYGNERCLKKFLRLIFYKIANYHFLYGNRARLLLIDLGFKPDRLFTVYNSLDHSKHKLLYQSRDLNELNQIKESIFPGMSDTPILLFIGRLTKKKKISLLINSIQILKANGKEFNCIIIGDGEEKNHLHSLVKELNLEKNIHFFGTCYDDSLSAKFIMLSHCCVSPGNVGLTAIHSMALGTPVITHDNLNNQMPEVESIVDGKTGFFFTEDSLVSLSQAIENFCNPGQKQKMEANCIAIIAKYFNPENQCKIISNAINSVQFSKTT